MTTNRILKFFISESGKSFVFRSVCVAGVGVFSLQYLPHTIGLSKYTEFMQLYQAGTPRQVPDKILRRFDQAIDICKCSEFEKKFIKPFMVAGFDTLHVGSLTSRYGALVGVPPNYCYDSIDQIQRGDIRLRHLEIDWSSPDGKMLQESLVLTEDEQVFGIARSILKLKESNLLVTSLFMPIGILVAYTVSSTVNKRANFYSRPLSLRLSLYGIVYLFAYGIYSFLTDFTEIHEETEVDKKLCDIGTECMDAGVRFYDKLLKKNIAIKNLLGDSSYTCKGNEPSILRQKRLPLTMRKQYFETRLAEAKNKTRETELGTESY